ncbi:MAG TPA: twin-arginine translocase TatA/TatE family subunit [Abditibacteriaceae bacterium]|jgi:sec-independent protein translocase protein TatA
MSLGTPELVVIFVLILLLFGPNRLPELARGLGKGMREFRKVTSEFQNQLSALGEHDEEPRRAPHDRANDNSNYQSTSYDSNKLDSTYNYDHSDDSDVTSTEGVDSYAPHTEENGAVQGSATHVSNGSPRLDAAAHHGATPHETAPHGAAPQAASMPDDTPSTNEPKPQV